MKKQIITRAVSLLLLAVMAISFMTACKKEENQDNQNPIDATTEENPNIPAKDYDGYEFRFICEPYGTDNAYSTKYMVAESEDGTVLNDAVYRRNSVLEQKYNIKISQNRVEDLVFTVRSQVLSGMTEFDLIVGSATDLANLARENALLDLNSIDRFDMTKSYWDSNAAEQLKIGDKLFFTNCDLNVQEIAFVVYFNKYLIEEYGLESPYKLMENNEWTIDKWAELVKSVSKDTQGDGLQTELDVYGTLYETHNTRMMAYGVGIRATTNDADGKPVVTLMDNKDKISSLYTKAKDVFGNTEVSWCINDMNKNDTHGYVDKFDYARSLFCQNLYLFHYEGTNIIHQFASMEKEFGIMPFPKFDSNQDSYYSMYPKLCAMVALPNIADATWLERTANIVEDMNYYSSIILEPAWYETLLARRYTRDSESEANLEVIKNGRVYDIGAYFDFGGIVSTVMGMDVRNSDNISRQYERSKKMIQSSIDNIYSDFTKEK